jgi:hypothetical protein
VATAAVHDIVMSRRERMLLQALLFAALLLSLSCAADTPGPEPGTASEVPPVLDSPSYEDQDLAAGQTVYVPVYSHVYQDRNKRPFNLVATLAVRNTDLTHTIQLTSVRYYDSRGRLVRNYVDDPVTIGPLATVDFAVDEKEENGSGTSFIVEWIAGEEVHEPVIEAVMISTALSQGLSFTSPGRVIRTLHTEAVAETE